MHKNIPYIIATSAALLAVLTAIVLTFFFYAQEDRGIANEPSTPSSRTSPSPQEKDPETPQKDIQNTNQEITWESTNILSQNSDLYNVTDMLVGEDGNTVYATYYDAQHQSYVSWTSDEGKTWTEIPLDRSINYPRALRRMEDGTLILAAGVTGRVSPFWISADNGRTWETVGDNYFPNPQATTGWDAVQLPDGRIILGTSALENDPTQSHPSIHELLPDGTVKNLASLPGMGIMSMITHNDGTIFATTQENIEHDNPATAGQARIFSSNDGITWKELTPPQGANRIYDLFIDSDGTLFAGTGVSGLLLKSEDKGETWEKTSPLPGGTLPQRGNLPIVSVTPTRVYSILELQNGGLLIGTGYALGDIYLTYDKGETWEVTKKPGSTIVSWALVQTANGGLYAGMGSFGGDILFSDAFVE